MAKTSAFLDTLYNSFVAQEFIPEKTLQEINDCSSSKKIAAALQQQRGVLSLRAADTALSALPLLFRL